MCATYKNIERERVVRVCAGAFIVSLAATLAGIGESAAQCIGTWTNPTTSHEPSNRRDAAMAYDSAHGLSVLFGGSAGSNETWVWDGTDWVMKSPAHSPAPRSGHAMAYDSARGVTVLFGGRKTDDGTLDAETWEWDGTDWTLRTPVNHPAPRSLHAMAYDSLRGVTVLFGGYQGPSNNETWEWDGYNWLYRPTSNGPGARYSHAMAYDSGRHVTVLFGMFVVNFYDVHGHPVPLGYSDTWEWDGGTWAKRTADSCGCQVGRFGHAMAYDSARGVMVLYGGTWPFGGDNKTFEWDGTQGVWMTRSSEGSNPGWKIGHSMAYDSARRVTVFFGGENLGSSIQTSTWEWVGGGASIVTQPQSVEAVPGQTVTLSVAVEGGGSYSYTWFKDGTTVQDIGGYSGSATSTLTIDSVGAEETGDYRCRVTSDCSTIFSNVASLSILDCNAPDPARDCDSNGVVDRCQIANDPAADTDGNGVLDSCEHIPTLCGLFGIGTLALSPIALVTLAMAVRSRSTRIR